jgi:hypothetical protein
MVQLHIDRIACAETGFSQNEFGSGRLVPVQVHSDQSLDHRSFAFANHCHVGRTRASHAAKFACVVDKIRNLGAPDFILAGKAVSFGAGATNPVSFDHRSLLVPIAPNARRDIFHPHRSR